MISSSDIPIPAELLANLPDRNAPTAQQLALTFEDVFKRAGGLPITLSDFEVGGY
jgi:hypothetical protein